MEDIKKQIKKINIYTCGPTVYDLPTLGNMRTIIWGNAIRNIKEILGYEVAYAMNFTDIDDKIIQKIMRDDVRWSDLTCKYISQITTILKNINVIREEDLLPKSSNFIDEIVDIIHQLKAKNLIYETDHEIFCNVDLTQYFTYGTSSNISDRNILHQSDKQKKEDYVLWKKTIDQKHWDTSLGAGRPGWHIECSAMIKNIFDLQYPIINIGGKDLCFPHQENSFYILKSVLPEIQIDKHSIGFLKIHDNIISKSKHNNIVPIDELTNYQWKIIKLFFLSVSSTKDQTCSTLSEIFLQYEKYYLNLISCITSLPAIQHENDYLNRIFKFENFNIYFSEIFKKSIDRELAQNIWNRIFE